MNTIHTQIDLYNKRNQIRTEIKPISFDKSSKNYIKNLFSINRKAIEILLIFVALLSLIEITIPLLLNFFLDKFAYQMNVSSFYITIAVVVSLLIFYILLSYFAIKNQKIIVLNIINKIRRDWLRFFIYKNINSFKDTDKSSLYVKLSYHLSLLQTGLQNSFFVFFQWIIFLFGILVVSSILDIQLLLISLVFVPINLLVFFISYILSSYYLAKDQTLYSKLLRYISDTFNSFSFIKSIKKEKEFLENVDHIVEIDNYFRIKRELVLNLGNRIIFVLLILFSVLMYVFNIYIPFNTESVFLSLVFALVFVLHLKLIYLSLKMGLFYFPLKLGLFLCVPPIRNKNKKSISLIEKINLSAKKVKLKNEGEYVKNISFDFEKGKAYLIEDLGNSTQKIITNVLNGINPKKISQNWVIKINNKDRFLYNYWMSSTKSLCHLHPHMYNDESLYDFLDNHPELDVLKKYEIFDFIFKNKRFLAMKMNISTMSFEEICLSQIAYALLLKPEIIIIDSLIQDIPYKKIKAALSILKQQASESIYITTSHIIQDKKDYHVVYTV